MLLFTDGSVDTKSKIGFGAYLIVDNHTILPDISSVKVKRFEDTSSTKLEIQVLLWALKDIEELRHKILVYTDSQNIVSLLKRRGKLEQTNYYSKKGRRLRNYLLYKEFYHLTSKIACEFYKVDGHLPFGKKNAIDKLFNLVDKASRKALREMHL